MLKLIPGMRPVNDSVVGRSCRYARVTELNDRAVKVFAVWIVSAKSRSHEKAGGGEIVVSDTGRNLDIVALGD